jgi:putative oligomerization/nucleic acid binding protein
MRRLAWGLPICFSLLGLGFAAVAIDDGLAAWFAGNATCHGGGGRFSGRGHTCTADEVQSIFQWLAAAFVGGSLIVLSIFWWAARRADDMQGLHSAYGNGAGAALRTGTIDLRGYTRPEGHGKGDPLERLRRLVELRDAGAVTPAEFEAQKAKLLAEL